MATTLAASAYFLTCCRPIHNSFCFLIEKPKLINFYHYPFEYFLKHPEQECKYDHDNLSDHNINSHNECTDDRAWSLDDRQRRQHFQDLIRHRIPHCCPDETSEDSHEESGKVKRKGKGKKGKTEEDDTIGTRPPDDATVKTRPPGDDTVGTRPGDDTVGTRPGDDTVGTRPGDETESLEENQPSAGKSKDYVPSLKSKSEPSLQSEKLKGDPSKHKEPESDPSDTGRLGLKPSDASEESTEQQSLIPKESEKLGAKPSATSEDSAVHTEKSLLLKEREKPLKSDDSEESGLEPSTKSSHSGKPKSKDPSVKSKESKKQVSKPKDAEEKESIPKDAEEKESIPKDAEEKESIPKDAADLTDELVAKLDRNLRNLEATFEKFVQKNRDFIQNLVNCLEFEKEKQKSLEDAYNKLKQDNEELKAQNDYLKMVNNKQLDLFKNELDKGISENKVIYKRKIHLMERQLQNDQNELQLYKQTEKKYMEVVEQDNEKIEKLNNKVEDLKKKEVQLVKNYLKLLKFLENVRNILSNADAKEIPQLRSLNTLTDYEDVNEQDIKRVLRNALSDGISTLNVRDLSILHDAIEEVNGGLCHQADKCTKSPTAASSYPDFSMMTVHRFMVDESTEDIPKQTEGYESTSKQSIDRIPTRQKPDSPNKTVSFT